MELKEAINYVIKSYKEAILEIIKESNGKDIDEQNLPKISPDMTIDCATRIYISSNIQAEKKETKKEPATSKQIYLLKKLHYEGDLNNLSKQEAMQIIKEYKEA